MVDRGTVVYMAGTGGPGSKFSWNMKSVKAAVLVAEDDMDDARIAEEVGIGLRTLERWKTIPEFKTKVNQHIEALEAEAMRLPIVKKRKRLRDYQDLSDRLNVIRDDRAVAFGDNPGGLSGLVVEQTKSVGYGKGSQIVTESAFDNALFRAMIDVRTQAAKEAGQWIDRGELTGKNGQPLTITEVVIDRSSAATASKEDDDDIDDDE